MSLFCASRPLKYIWLGPPTRFHCMNNRRRLLFMQCLELQFTIILSSAALDKVNMRMWHSAIEDRSVTTRMLQLNLDRNFLRVYMAPTRRGDYDAFLQRISKNLHEDAKYAPWRRFMPLPSPTPCLTGDRRF